MMFRAEGKGCVSGGLASKHTSGCLFRQGDGVLVTEASGLSREGRGAVHVARTRGQAVPAKWEKWWVSLSYNLTPVTRRDQKGPGPGQGLGDEIATERWAGRRDV